MSMDFNKFKDMMVNEFDWEVDCYEDVIDYIKIVIWMEVQEEEAVEYAEKEYEKLVEENNKLLAEIGKLKDKIKEE